VHLQTFDFSRILAILWIILFAVTPVVMAAILLRHPAGHVAEGPRLPVWVRMLLGLFSLLSVGYGVALWIDPVRFGTPFPFEPPPLGGRFVGCWLFFLATLAAYAAARNHYAESRVSLVGLTTFPLGALLGALRTFGDLEPSGPLYVAVLSLIALVAIALTATSRVQATADPAYARATST
jgi:hypothetical protein